MDQGFAELLNRYSKEEVANSIIFFKPAVADISVAEKLNLKKSDPLMQWRETSYSVFDHVICLSRITFHPELVNLTLLRKWK
jgi:DNA-binding GntR family transcriptional regulator